MFAKDVLIHNPSGLHAKPMIDLSRVVKKYKSELTIINGRFVTNPRSFFSMVEGEFEPGAIIRVAAEGEDEVEAVHAICAFVEALKD